MKKSYCILLGLLACLSPVFGQGDADTVISASEQVPAKIVTINTSVGTLKENYMTMSLTTSAPLLNVPNGANTTERCSHAYSLNL